MSLDLAVGNGTSFSYAGITPQWQAGQTYTANVVLTAAGPQQLFLNGQLVGTATGSFTPMPGALYGSEVPSWAAGQEDYLVEQTGLQVTNGSQAISLPATGTWFSPPRSCFSLAARQSGPHRSMTMRTKRSPLRQPSRSGPRFPIRRSTTRTSISMGSRTSRRFDFKVRK